MMRRTIVIFGVHFTYEIVSFYCGSDVDMPVLFYYLKFTRSFISLLGLIAGYVINFKCKKWFE
jgi:hypothetical protein